MKGLFFRLPFLGWALWLSPGRASAQAVTVQQPAVSVFSVDTVVSVPDRGRMFLGGVSSAGGQRSSYGFGPLRQSSSSHFARSGSADVGVSILDFEAMDQALLNQSPARTTAATSLPHAEDDWLYQERRRPVAAQSGGASTASARNVARTGPSTHGPPETNDATQLAAFYLERGRSAESKGKTGAAAICYRMAVKYGSRDAADRLTALAKK
jgi:hypothetical protein